MMKKKALYILLLTAFVFAACSEGGCPQAYEIRPLKLSSDCALLGQGDEIVNPLSTVIDIVDGNGGYRVYQPWKVSINNKEVDNDLQLVKATVIDDSKIRVERLTDDTYMNAMLLVVDSKGEKAILRVKDSYAMLGGGFSEETKDRLLYGKDIGETWDMSKYY